MKSARYGVIGKTRPFLGNPDRPLESTYANFIPAKKSAMRALNRWFVCET
jgi:hypothetical protein